MESALDLDLGSQGFKEVLAKVARFGSYCCSTGQSSDILHQVPTRSFKNPYSFSIHFRCVQQEGGRRRTQICPNSSPTS